MCGRLLSKGNVTKNFNMIQFCDDFSVMCDNTVVYVNYLFSCLCSFLLQIWNVSSKDCKTTLLHSCAVLSCDFSPNQERLVTGNTEGVVLVSVYDYVCLKYLRNRETFSLWLSLFQKTKPGTYFTNTRCLYTLAIMFVADLLAQYAITCVSATYQIDCAVHYNLIGKY